MVWLPLTVCSVRMDLSRAATRSFQVEERQLTAGCAEDSTRISDLLQRLAPNGKHSNAINYFTF